MTTATAASGTTDRSVERADDADRSVRISDFALMAVLPYRGLEFDGLPLNEIAMAALVGLAVFRSARGGARLHAPILLTAAALLALLTYSGLANDVDWFRRVGHVGVMVGLIWAMGTGRISLRSSGLGLGVGLASVIGLALMDVGGDSYPGRLTGYLSDPNAGAYFIVALGTLAIFFCDDHWQVRLFVAFPIVAGLVLSYSRTGLLAGAFAVVWILIGRRLGQVAGAALAAGVVLIVANVPEDLQTFGPFSNRTGSDALRKRIIAQEHVQLADMPWFGHGPGTASVDVRGVSFFYHNSYLATRQEGGWVSLALVLLLMALVFAALLTPARRGDLHAAAAQASLVSVAAMAITLGEVLLDLPMAIAVGFALGHLLRTRERGQPHA